MRKLIVDFSNGTLPYCENGKWGLVDGNNEVRINAEYDSVFYAGPELCILKKDAKYSFFTQDFEELLVLENIHLKIMGNCFQVYESSEFLNYRDGKLVRYKSEEAYKKYNAERRRKEEMELAFFLDYRRELGIDSIQTEFIEDSLRLIIHYADGNNIVTPYSTIFHFKAPHFFHFEIGKSTNKDQKIVNMSQRTVTPFNQGYISNSHTIQKKNYFNVYHGLYSELYDEDLNFVFRANGKISSWENLICIDSGDYKKLTTIIDFPSGKVLLKKQSYFEQKKHYLIAVDSMNHFAMINKMGEVIYSGDYSTIDREDDLRVPFSERDKMTHKLIRIVKPRGEILLSTSGKVLLDRNCRVMWYEHGVLVFKSIDSRSGKFQEIGRYDDEKDSLSTIYASDVKTVNDSLCFIKVHKLWYCVDAKWKYLLPYGYESVRIDDFRGAGKSILTLRRHGEITRMNEQLEVLSLDIADHLLLNPINTIHSEWEDAEMAYVRILDKKERMNVGLMNEDYKVLPIEGLVAIFANPKSNYFFVRLEDGRYGYMRSDGRMLF